MTPGGRGGAAGRGIDARRAVALVALCALTVACPPSLAAQAAPPIRQAFPMPEEYRGIQLRAQETQRTLLLAMVDSMPEALFRRAAADGQRDFAEQVHHAANANQYIVAHYQLGWDSLPVRADTAVVFNTRAGLRAFVDASYGFSIRVLREQPAAERQGLIWYFGQKMPRWMVWDELNQHTIWTAGQIVANFRAAGMAPPSFLYF
ncbi:MAG: hypothetical protein IPI38_09885 [Gemmatimonadetes bacterium]|nr:hypothetical protein [Gemmatimonadota bacterium]MBK6781677.1 hypothetical protein [Gemmatimonadota bacterium]MBK7715720.1 hypothetical protein [Gemmatimonadota bacterium]MBK7925685.1 hypothetical protein [Gemmatimonadota bacterium]MBK9691051.1 hypothetical protein [Gemmatimonadota bacterium]